MSDLTPEALACPKCGCEPRHDPVSFWEHVYGRPVRHIIHRIRCSRCTFTGDSADDIREAVSNWNHKVTAEARAIESRQAARGVAMGKKEGANA